MARKRSISTPTYVKAYAEKRTRIRIPQSPAKPVVLVKQNILQKEKLKDNPSWYKVHTRGVRRPKMGEDTREKRAVSKYSVRGTLPERILYKALVEQVHLVSGVDFDFQSSMQGGRMELGGLVVDFILPIMMIAIQVQGQTHQGFLRSRKDEEQNAILQSMGYRVIDVEEQLIYDEYAFNDWLKRVFNLALSSSSGRVYVPPPIRPVTQTITQEDTSTQTDDPEIYNQDELQGILQTITGLFDLVGRM